MTLVTRYRSGIKDHICKQNGNFFHGIRGQGTLLCGPVYPAASSANRLLLVSSASSSVPADGHLMGSQGQLPRALHNF